MSFTVIFDQCDQIGHILKVLGHKFDYKSTPNVFWHFGLFWKHPFSFVNFSNYFLGNFWKFLGHFIFTRLVTLSLMPKRHSWVSANSYGAAPSGLYSCYQFRWLGLETKVSKAYLILFVVCVLDEHQVTSNKS